MLESIQKEIQAEDSYMNLKETDIQPFSPTPENSIKMVSGTSSTQNLLPGKRLSINRPKTINLDNIIGKCSSIQTVFNTIEKVARTESTVLITGESGTGKELTARAIHVNSSRADKPLVTLNCGAIPGELLESELFGHEKGAFTGAHQTRIGRFERASGGTIFLDEIGEMSPNLQVKLLRVIQEQQFERVGGCKTINVDIRIISATNINLNRAMKEGKFREDLYYRLNVIPIHMPPLRERKSDIPLLINFFQNKIGNKRKSIDDHQKTFSDEALAALTAYKWRGNIRELENLVERLSILTDAEVIQLEDLPEKIRTQDLETVRPSNTKINGGINFNQAVFQYQRNLILQALNQTNWIKAKAAELLKINRTTLVEKIKKMDIDRERKKSRGDIAETVRATSHFFPRDGAEAVQLA